VTASAFMVQPDTGRVLLRWHQRQGSRLQVGGHANPGEEDPLSIALREAVEESRLTDLRPWLNASLLHLVVVQVPAGRGEPAHQRLHGLKSLLAQRTPDPALGDSPARVIR
jgi:8-oxo-dGTP pyrophosphatase MutT (NUDIX family)